METLELFYPQIAAQAGPYRLDQGIKFEIFSAKSSYFDWAKIRFTEEFQPEISLARKDPAAIELGYDGIMEEVFTGFVTCPYNKGGGVDEITLKDEMLLLEDTQINDTFLNTTPQEVISYILAQAGVGEKKLNGQDFPIRKKLPIWQMSGVQAINAVNAAWGIRKRFFFSGGVFYWGEKPEQQKVYTFEYGVNIISLCNLLSFDLIQVCLNRVPDHLRPDNSLQFAAHERQHIVPAFPVVSPTHSSALLGRCLCPHGNRLPPFSLS